ALVGRLLRTIAECGRPTATVVLSDRRQLRQTTALLRQGVADYLSQPFDWDRVARLLDRLTLRYRVPAPPGGTPGAVQSLGEGEPFYYSRVAATGQFMEQLQRVIPKDTTLLLTGETGTGKTRLARLVHELSPRCLEPFLVVNCGALSANLIESEMFGHVRGAFTGAERDRAGKFADAAAGTLL